MELNSTIKSIQGGIAIFKTTYDIYTNVKTKAIHRIHTPQLIDTISSEYFNGNLKASSIITTNGYLSRYCNLYYPRTYASNIPGVSSHKYLGYEQKNGKMLGKAQQTTTYQLFQIPVQTLPLLPGNNEAFQVGYLYPNNFRSFILEIDEKKKNNKLADDNLLISNEVKPIPVLLNKDDFNKLCENNIKITGIITEIPNEMEEQITSRFNSTLMDFSYNYFRPYSPRIGFCIDCRLKSSSGFTTINSKNNLRGAIYIEAHFQDYNDDSLENEIRKVIPDVLPLVFKTGDKPEITPYCTTGDIRVIRRDGNIYGFYTETDLLDQEEYEVKLKKLHATYDSFRKKSQQVIRSITGKDFKLKPDFIYDYRRQKLFHPDGVLLSNEINTIMENDNTTSNIIDWLRQ